MAKKSLPEKRRSSDTTTVTKTVTYTRAEVATRYILYAIMAICAYLFTDDYFIESAPRYARTLLGCIQAVAIVFRGLIDKSLTGATASTVQGDRSEEIDEGARNENAG